MNNCKISHKLLCRNSWWLWTNSFV